MAAVWAVVGLTACHPVQKAPDLPHAPASLSERFLAPRGWTWSSIRLKDGATLRYGVASPPVAPRGNILILPDYGEPAEVWFETANDLNDRGYTVWLLEGGAGKGAAALDPAQGALSIMVRDIIRAPAKAPLVVVGQGLGSTLALRALGEGHVTNVKAALLASPTLDLAGIDPAALAWRIAPEQAETAAEWASRARMGWLTLPGDGQPRLTRTKAMDLDPTRAGLAGVWRRSDPTLTPKPTTFGWVWGYDQAIRAARAPSSDLAIPIVIAATTGDGRAAASCRRLPHCSLWMLPTSAPHLAPDTMRRTWLNRVVILMEDGRRP